MDAARLTILRGALETICDEQDDLLVRGAFSPIISEIRDRAHGVYHPQTGETVTQGSTSNASFVQSMQFAVQHVIGRYQGDIAPGDVFIVNDPVVGGAHLHDIKLIKPVFRDGVLLAFLASSAHFVDLGGAVFAGKNPRATHIFQEGLRIPAIKLCQRGKLNEALLELLLHNTRLPNENRHDLMTMLGTLELGEERFLELTGRVGTQSLLVGFDRLLEASERQMAACIGDMHPGDYEAEGWLDSDGVTEEPLRFFLTLGVTQDQLTFDFTGSSPAGRGPFNSNRVLTMAGCFMAVTYFWSELDLCGGAARRLRYVLPEGSVVNPPSESPHEMTSDVRHKVIAVAIEALSKALPERGEAATCAMVPAMAISGRHPETGRRFVQHVALLGGGGGATAWGDGLSNTSGVAHGMRMASLEVLEQRFPWRYHRYSLRPDSGGAGRHRGGLGVELEVEFLGDEGQTTLVWEEQKFPPRGLLGGSPGKPAEVYLARSGAPFERLVGKHSEIVLHRGDRVLLRTPGGGGYGHPDERPWELLEADLGEGYLTPSAVTAEYRRPGAVAGVTHASSQ